MTIALKFSDADFTRISQALGISLGLLDGAAKIRDANQSEITAWTSGRLQQLVVDIEGAAAAKAIPAIVPPTAL